MAKDAADMPDPLDCHAGIMVRTRRNEIGMSQSQLAELCGVTFQQIQKYERAANRISFSRLVQLSAALRVTPAFFFEGVSDAGEDPTGTREATEFLKSPEGQIIAHSAAKLAPKHLRAVADLARNLADLGVA